MRLDEMIIKANTDGKTYVNRKDCVTYSASSGFSGEDIASLFNDGWEELPKRHLTVSEAEKELDCVIDTPDISRLLRSMSEYPDNSRDVIIINGDTGINSTLYGFYDKVDSCWRWRCGAKHRICYGGSFHWIDPADLIKLLPKE